MPKDRDQLTPDDPDDAAYLARTRGQGTGGSGLDQIGEAQPGPPDVPKVPEDPDTNGDQP